MNARLKVVPAPLKNVEELTKAYARERDVLAERVSALNAELETAKRRAMTGIKSALARAAEAQAELRAAIEAAPATFEKPRTHIFYGIKVGYRKGSGKVTFTDAEQTLKLIRKHFPEQADLLIKTKESPNKEAIADLPAPDVAKIGCAIEGTGDVVEIKPVDSDVDKLVAALLKEATDEAEGQ